MAIFKPNSIGETVAVGGGLGSELGHSLLMTGELWEEWESFPEPHAIFCSGYFRVQRRSEASDSDMGVFQIAMIDGAPNLNATLMVWDVDFASMRQVLLTGGENVQIEIVGQSHETLLDMLKRREPTAITAASMSSTYKKFASIGTATRNV